MSTFKTFLEGVGQKVWVFAYMYEGEETDAGDVLGDVEVFSTEVACVKAMVKILKKDYAEEQLDTDEVDLDKIKTLKAFFDAIDGNDYSHRFHVEKKTLK